MTPLYSHVRPRSVHRPLAVRFLAFLVMAHGAYILTVTLLEQIAIHRGSHLTNSDIDVSLLVGLSLIYLGTLLGRRKRTAWLVTIMAYVFYLGVSVNELLARVNFHNLTAELLIRLLVLPLLVLSLLVVFRRDFVVKSDVQGFRFAARFAVLILAAAMIYGTVGFLMLDDSDLHRELSLPSAAHYTIDQFNITTTKPLHPYTRRAKLFLDSLSVVSSGAVIYAAISLFQPLRMRLSDQHVQRQQMTGLLRQYSAPSEDFFKLWPHDKQYFFDATGHSGLAFHVKRGVALCVSDPVGNTRQFNDLLNSFDETCFGNDWQPAFIHVSDEHRALYEHHDFAMQKLGQEAILNLDHFQSEVAGQKYFRQIRNKFTKHGYTSELLSPPHHQAVLDRLNAVSKEWLSRGGRAERGFVMGYYSSEYMQQCEIMVARDAAGTIQAFTNLVPAVFDRQEATYDLLRHASKCLSNVNDFLLMELISQLQARGYSRLNLGLCPLAGLDKTDSDETNLIDGIMRFVYSNGDRFYSFSGLKRFKAKYEPEWHDRYVAYRGGLRGFSKAMTSLMLTMRI